LDPYDEQSGVDEEAGLKHVKGNKSELAASTDLNNDLHNDDADLSMCVINKKTCDASPFVKIDLNKSESLESVFKNRQLQVSFEGDISDEKTIDEPNTTSPQQLSSFHVGQERRKASLNLSPKLAPHVSEEEKRRYFQELQDSVVKPIPCNSVIVPIQKSSAFSRKERKASVDKKDKGPPPETRHTTEGFVEHVFPSFHCKQRADRCYGKTVQLYSPIPSYNRIDHSDTLGDQDKPRSSENTIAKTAIHMVRKQSFETNLLNTQNLNDNRSEMEVSSCTGTGETKCPSGLPNILKRFISSTTRSPTRPAVSSVQKSSSFGSFFNIQEPTFDADDTTCNETSEKPVVANVSSFATRRKYSLDTATTTNPVPRIESVKNEGQSSEVQKDSHNDQEDVLTMLIQASNDLLACRFTHAEE